MADIVSDFEFKPIIPAETLEQMWTVFDPTTAADPRSEFYVPRRDPELQKLLFEFQHTPDPLHVFLCGHRGSGKTTELARLCMDSTIMDNYYPIYLNAQNFIGETVHLTHDAFLVEIGLKIDSVGRSVGLNPSFGKELESWGKQIVETFLHDKTAKTEAVLKPYIRKLAENDS